MRSISAVSPPNRGRVSLTVRRSASPPTQCPLAVCSRCRRHLDAKRVSFTGLARLLQAVKPGLRKIQYQPALIDGCLTGAGLSLEPKHPHQELKVVK
jgi:hypothetical protein